MWALACQMVSTSACVANFGSVMLDILFAVVLFAPLLLLPVAASSVLGAVLTATSRFSVFTAFDLAALAFAIALLAVLLLEEVFFSDGPNSSGFVTRVYS